MRSVVTQTVGGIDGKLYIGTTKGCILDGSLQLKFRYIVQVGHVFTFKNHHLPNYINSISSKIYDCMYPYSNKDVSKKENVFVIYCDILSMN